MRSPHRLGFPLAAVLAVLAPDAAALQQDMRECDLTDTAAIPLPDAGGLWYRRVGLVQEYAAAPNGPEWRQVGLYGQGRTTRPADHEAAGVAIARGIAPIGGRIGIVSIGMSNTQQEFARFLTRAQTDAAVSPAVRIVNAAQGGQPADEWQDPGAATWQTALTRVAQAGMTPDQVQVAWIKHAVRSPQLPPLSFPAHPEALTDILADVVTSLKVNFPNVRLCYVSSRTRAYNTNQTAISPEPAAYEGGFATQWLIERQLDGDPSLRYDGTDPPAPWLAWGPYLWIDGLDARSDGALWVCDDVSADGIHPSPPTPGAGPPEGEHKVGDQLMAFFLTDATTAPWFLATESGGPTLTALTANGVDVLGGGRVFGAAPLGVSFAVMAAGDVAGTSWTYGDGTFSYNDAGNAEGAPFFDNHASPAKTFHVAGTYGVRVAVRDSAGATTLVEIPVVVSGGAPGVPFCLGTACPCGNDSAQGGCANSTGAGALLAASGGRSVAADDLVLTTTGAPPLNSGLYFVGAAALAPVTVGDGLACTGGLWRYAAGQVDASGTFTLTEPVGGAFPGAIQPGDTRHFQAWTRDVLCGPPPAPCPSPCMNGSNLSNGVSVTFSP
jgi:hypothetical protein